MTLQLTQTSTLLTKRYHVADSMKSLLDSQVENWQELIVDPAQQLKEKGTIKADGVWLDLLAKRFRITRPTKPATEVKYFGFSGNPKAVGFNQDPFFPKGGDPNVEQVPMPDGLFRQFLQIVVSGLRSNGTQDVINQIVGDALPGSYVLDNLDMTMTLVISLDDAEYDYDLSALSDQVVPKPCGVGLEIEIYESFGFDGAGSIFDDGPFALD